MLQNKINQIVSLYYRYICLEASLLMTPFGNYFNDSKNTDFFLAVFLYISYNKMHLLWHILKVNTDIYFSLYPQTVLMNIKFCVYIFVTPETCYNAVSSLFRGELVI